MNKFLNFGKSLWKDEAGATAIEYGLLAALISVAIIITVSSLGTTLSGVFSNVDGKLKPSAAASGGTGTGTGG
ncbi:MAG: Flp family type IVb pilin [Amaricoccus sp.]